MEENRRTDWPRLMRRFGRAFEALARRDRAGKRRGLRSRMPSAADFRAQVDAAVACGDASGEATARVDLAAVLQSQQDPTALAEFDAALHACQRTDDARSEAVLLLKFIPIFLERQDQHRALTLADRAVEITARSRLDHHMLALFQLGRVWIEGFKDLKKGRAALREAAEVFEQARARRDPAAAEIAQTLATAILQAAETALKTGDSELVLRLAAVADPDAGQHLEETATPVLRSSPATEDGVAPVPSLSLPELKACAEEEYDELLVAWRTTRTHGRIAHPELLPPALHAAAETLAKNYAWDDARAFMAVPSQEIDFASATRGGPAGILRLSEYLAAGCIARDDAVQLAAQLGVGDDDLAFLIAVPGGAPGRGPLVLVGLLELVGAVAQDNLFAARCLHMLSTLTARDGKSIETLRLLDQAAARLADAADPVLRAEILNELAVGLSDRGSLLEALVKAHEARALALDCGATSLARLALGSVGQVLLALDCAREALDAFKQLEAEQQAAGESAELDATRLNMDVARMLLGELHAPALEEPSSDPDHAFLDAHRCAQQGDAAGAIEIYREAFDRLRDAPPYEREAEARANFAAVLDQAGQQPEAAAELRAAAKLFEARTDTPGLVCALCRLASPTLSPLPTAQANAERAVELAKTLGNPDTLAEAFGALGVVETLRGQIDKGLSAYEQAAATAPNASRQIALAEARVSAGLAEEALPVFESVLAAAGDADPRSRVAALSGRGEALRILGRAREALQDLQEANEAAVTLEPSEVTAYARARLGWVLIESGAIKDGILVAEDALQHARDLKADRLEIAILNNLGMGLNESGDPAGARASFEAARARARAISSIDAEAAAVFGLGQVAASEHKTIEAQSHYREAAGMAGQTNNSRLEAVALDSLALLHLRGRDPARAIDLQKRAAELHQKLRDWNGHVTDLVNLISAYVLLRDADNAAATLREAKAVVQKHRLPRLPPILQLKAAQIDALRGDWPSARKSYRAGLRQLESEEAELSTPAAQRRWHSRRMEAYSLAIEDAVLAGDAPAALEFLESNRTHFFEAVHLRRGRRPADVPEELMRQYELARGHLDELLRQRPESIGPPDSTFECALAEAHASCEGLRSLVETADQAAPPAPSASKFEFPTFKSLARAIPRGHAVVSMSIQNGGTAVVCVGRSDDGKVWTTTRLEPALDGARLRELVLGDSEAWRQARSSDDVPDAAPAWALVTGNEAPDLRQRAFRRMAEELGARLWPMIESAVEGRTHRLILMPGAGFAVLPLHAAVLANGMRAQDRFEIRYAPSLSLFQRASRLASVGLPPSLGQLIPPTPDLPFAPLEAARVARHLGAANQARVEGPAATPDAALALLESPGIFHFTGRGAFNSNEPLRSRLVCAGEGADGQGLLTMRMLIERAEHLKCNLAILSACESGRVEAADHMNETLGLPGALLAAGCGGVIATFWPVRDLVASLVLDQTFETWRAGSITLPAALTRATRWLRDATMEKVCERLAVWRDENPEFAPLLETAIDELRQRARARPFADEIDWAAFHVVGNPELPRQP